MVTTNDNQQFFCVFVGWIPGIYTSSEEVAEQLHDYRDGGWMEFSTLDNAEEAWALFQENGDAKKGRNMIANGKAPAGLQQPERRQMERIALKALHSRFEEDHHHTIPHPRQAFVVTSRVASELHMSLEDSARFCLRKIYQNLNGYVDDYNLDLVLRWKERYVDLARDMGKLETRLQKVTRYNDALQKVVNRANKTR
ncbi:uncharacterized protein DS421_14g460390 [Arachis hypogaea]|nr:uncharacterized protein DS421_14g460390 [Arachis hypogaea]